MKILGRTLIGLFLAIVLFGLTSGSAEAADFKTEDNYTLAAGETLNDDLFVSANTATIDGDIDGDLFVSGNDVTINGNVSGNVFAGGDMVVISGNVAGDVFAAGREFILTGSADDVRIGAGFVTIDGDIRGDLMVGSGNVKINGVIGNDAFVGTESLSFSESAKIGGKLSYATPEPIAAAGRVASSSEHFESNFEASTEFEAPSAFGLFGNWIWRTIMAVIGYVAIAWLLFKFMPRFMDRSVTVLNKDLGKSAGWGLVLFVLAPAVFFFTTIVIGLFFGFGAALALSFTAFSSLALLWVVSPIVIGYWVGSRFTEQGMIGILGAVAAAAILITLPLVGGIFAFASYILVLGSLVLAIRNGDNGDQIKDGVQVQAA
ncbi:MAG: hypothetical protein AB8G95_20305 [Anaerolineae bacterium]